MLTASMPYFSILFWFEKRQDALCKGAACSHVHLGKIFSDINTEILKLHIHYPLQTCDQISRGGEVHLLKEKFISLQDYGVPIPAHFTPP